LYCLRCPTHHLSLLCHPCCTFCQIVVVVVTAVVVAVAIVIAVTVAVLIAVALAAGYDCTSIMKPEMKRRSKSTSTLARDLDPSSRYGYNADALLTQRPKQAGATVDLF